MSEWSWMSEWGVVLSECVGNCVEDCVREIVCDNVRLFVVGCGCVQ